MTESVETILARLGRLHPKRIDLGLTRINRLLARLGQPQTKLPPVVHIAGTNGKGSVGAFHRAIFAAAGLRVHSYVSPHLVRFNERILLAGQEVSDRALAAVLAQAEAANDGAQITFFEITTCAAMLAYAEIPADVLVLETGLGGRLDTTNVVAKPALSAITPISLDHQEFLGHDLASIAAEKAGILKAGVVGVIGLQPREVQAVLAKRAEEIGARLFRRGIEWDITRTKQGFRYAGERWRMELPEPSLPGRHQIDNAGLAVACMERLPGLTIPHKALAKGLTETYWPGRLQRLKTGPLVAGLPPGTELWLDGGHNASAGAALADMAAAWQAQDGKPLKLIVGMQANRDPTAMLAPLAGAAGGGVAELCAVQQPPQDNMHEAATIAAAADGLGIRSGTADSLAQAVDALAGADQPAARLLVCGSLYLVGWLLRDHG
ncbi:MAG: bifunctional folylpolyglutamate synthase/dihydrofolate synthase [Alphaproteobacteria bacterium]